MESDDSKKGLILEYKKKKALIRKRIKEFRYIYKCKEGVLCRELCFCILTPQSRAINCDRAIRRLDNFGFLFKGNRDVIKSKLKGVRFPNQKTSYILAARKLFKNGSGVGIKEMLKQGDPFGTREWLVKNVKGIGYKEASHFLRNIGLGRDMAVLDVHILRNLKRYDIIEKIPDSLTRNSYMDIENRMRKFSRKINIPMEELDLLFWSEETGFIFK